MKSGRRLVVIGAGQGGLSAAVHAQLLGWEVLVLEQNEVIGGKAGGIEIEGYQLDPGPSIVIMTDIYRSVFQAAGRRMEDFLTFTRLDPFSRIWMEGKGEPLDLPSGRESCLKMLQKAVPEDYEGLLRLLLKLDQAADPIKRTIFSKPLHHPWQLADPRLISAASKFNLQLSYKELVESFFSSRLLRAFFYGFPSYSGQSYHSKAAGALMIPYYMIEGGVWWPEGGVAAIPRAFARLGKELGVQFRTGAKVCSLLMEKGRVAGVALESGEVIPCDALISNRDRLSFAKDLGRGEPKRPSSSYCTFHWGVRQVLQHLSHHTLLVPEGFAVGFEELYSQNLPQASPVIYLNSTPAPPGRTCLFAVLTVPAREDHFDWQEAAPRLKQRVRSRLDQWGMGFDDSELDFERIQTPLTFEERDGSCRGSLYGAQESERLWGMLPLKVKDDQIPNLFYAGGTVQPGAGLPMVTLSGRFAAGCLPRL